MPDRSFPIDVSLLQREAAFAAARLIRRMGLPAQDHDDLVHDLLVHLLGRLRFFRPSRGCPATFVRLVLTHQLARLARRLARERLNSVMSLDAPVADAPDLTVGDTVPESAGYGAVVGQPVDRFAAVERRLDLGRALASLSPHQVALCADLVAHTPTELASGRPRASLYRQIRDIRLCLTVAGLSAAETVGVAAE